MESVKTKIFSNSQASRNPGPIADAVTQAGVRVALVKF
jgi:hypothetical protein